jgi:hypothetical protein
VEAGLGDKEAALGPTERALQAAAASDDLVSAPGADESFAVIEAQIRNQDAAIARIGRLLTLVHAAFPLTQAKLRTNPERDP